MSDALGKPPPLTCLSAYIFRETPSSEDSTFTKLCTSWGSRVEHGNSAVYSVQEDYKILPGLLI